MMKGYRKFVIVLTALLVIYIVAEMNRPKQLNWDVTLAKDDKNPYGGFILFNLVKELFPSAQLNTYRLPVYNQVNNYKGDKSAYLLIDPSLALKDIDVHELLNYARAGNYVFLSAESFGEALMDTLKFRTMRRFDLLSEDSQKVRFQNIALNKGKTYGFKRMTLDGYLSQFDTLNSIVLGSNLRNDINFIRMPFGKGAIFIHASPLCFSNYFMVTGDNADYTAKALSYLPPDVKNILWDEYYKLGTEGSRNPLRFLLNDPFLKWAFRIAIVAMVLFVLFEMKRRQRVIPVINPLKNSTLEFVETVGTVYFNQRNNKNIALKKISYFLEYVRSVFYLPTAQLNDELRESLAKKSGLPEHEIEELFKLVSIVHVRDNIDDDTLLLINKKIDSFYEKVK